MYPKKRQSYDLRGKCTVNPILERSDTHMNTGSPQQSLNEDKKSDLGRTLRPNRAPWSGPLRRFYHLNDHEIFVTVQSRPVLMSIEIPSSLSISFLFISPPSFLPPFPTLFRPFLDHTNPGPS